MSKKHPNEPAPSTALTPQLWNYARNRTLEIWEYLASHPQCLSKQSAIIALGHPLEDHDHIKGETGNSWCWACYIDSLYGDDCTHCPVTWPETIYDQLYCNHPDSPFYTWRKALSHDARAHAAEAVYQLIINTWIEKEIT